MPDQGFAQFLRDTYFAYQRGVYLGEIEPPELPTHEHQEHPGIVFVSALGFCPLAAAKERSEAPPVLPDKQRHNNFTALHNMALGSETQELLQRALCWKARYRGGRSGMTFQEWFDWANQPIHDTTSSFAFTEVSVESKDLRICGRMDAIWVESGPWGLQGKGVEIKYRAGYKIVPKLTDLYQMISYHLITGFEMWLVITNHFDIYRMEEALDGWQLVREDGSFTGLYISRADYHSERQRHLAYLDGAETGPAFNPAHSPNGWDCGHKKAPTKTKPGVITPTCPYWCHAPITEEGQTFEYDDDGIVIAF